MYNSLFFIILGIILLKFGVNQWLAYLNCKSASRQLPDAVKDIYDADEYARQQAYFRANNRFELIRNSFSLSLILIMLLTGGFGWWYQQIEALQWSLLPTLSLFFGSLYFGYKSLLLLFEMYRVFHIENHFALNQATPQIFATDTLKSWGQDILFGIILLSLLVVMYQYTSNWFGITTLAALFILGLPFKLMYNRWIIHLFLKRTPIREGELHDAILAFCEQADFTVESISIIDTSHHTLKPSIFFNKKGVKNRVELYDTLVNTLSTEEIVAALAHEIGRTEQGSASQTHIGAFFTGLLICYLPNLTSNSELAHALGVDNPSLAMALVSFALFYIPLEIITRFEFISRAHRVAFQADAFVASFGLSQPFISALKKLTAKSLGNPAPHPAYAKMFYSHPPLWQRIDRLTKSVSNV